MNCVKRVLCIKEIGSLTMCLLYMSTRLYKPWYFVFDFFLVIIVININHIVYIIICVNYSALHGRCDWQNKLSYSYSFYYLIVFFSSFSFSCIYIWVLYSFILCVVNLLFCWRHGDVLLVLPLCHLLSGGEMYHWKLYHMYFKDLLCLQKSWNKLPLYPC